MLYLIGLGLGDVEDVTVKGLKAIKCCAQVYLESYTSILPHGPSKEKLEAYYGREVILADREMVEQGCDVMLDAAVSSDVAMLVVGDPFGATTHSDLVLRAKERSIPVQIIHNASIMNACACSGLQLYNFGMTVSICFWTDSWQPSSYFEKIKKNHQLGLHTLCLLDIKVKEQTIENLMKGNSIFEPPRYMTVNEAAIQLLQIIRDERHEKSNGDNKYDSSSRSELSISENTYCVGLARVGWPDQVIRFGTLRQMSLVDMGPPLHSLIICGHLHDLELSFLKFHAISS